MGPLGIGNTEEKPFPIEFVYLRPMLLRAEAGVVMRTKRHAEPPAMLLRLAGNRQQRC